MTAKDQPPLQMELVLTQSSPDNNKSKSTTSTPKEEKSESELKSEKCKLFLLVQVSRALPLVAGFGCIIFIIVLLANPDNWKVNQDASDQDILDRESNRGVFVSVLIAILLNFIGAFMFYIQVKESLVVTNYGFILGPVIGYMLDQAIGTDAGFQYFFQAKGFAYTFSSLIDGNFVRYIVTVFLDLFISNPLQDLLKNQVKKIGVIEYLKEPKLMSGSDKHKFLIFYDNFVALNYPSLLQSIIAFVTFNAYTNQTRFAWAYPSEQLDRQLRIPPGSIMLSAAIAGVLYLNFYTIMDYISEREYFDINTKIMYVLFILGLLYGLNQTNSIEAPVAGELDENYTAILGDSKPFIGFLLFLMFVSYGFVYPVYTRLGFFGYCKPKKTDTIDHIAQVEQNERTIDDIKEEIKEELKHEFNKYLRNQHIRRISQLDIPEKNELMKPKPMS